MHIEAFFDPRTHTLTYAVSDPVTRDALVIDPVLDYDPANARISGHSVKRVIAHLHREGLALRAVLETHAHEDHLSAARVLRARFPGAFVAIGERIREVQADLKAALALGDELTADGAQFDRLLADDETFAAGSLQVRVIATPGHSPACVSYLVGDAVFTGDALLMPDHGTGRCDLPRGSAAALHRSVTERLYTLPPATRVFVGHDDMPGERGLAYESTIAAERACNVQLPFGRDVEEFVALRGCRDATLDTPSLLWPGLQVNVRGGRLPAPAFFKTPFTLEHPLDGLPG